MRLTEIEAGVAELDAAFTPAAKTPVDISDPHWWEMLAARYATPLMDQLGVRDRTEALLYAIIEHYATGDDAARDAIRAMFNRYTSFRWAAHLPHNWHTAADFRARLIHLSARDQGPDTRDEILHLQGLCSRARQAGLDIQPILADVAAISSDVDRHGMGSTRDVILRYAPADPPAR